RKCLPLVPLTSFLAPRPPDRLNESAGDSLRLTRTGQAKSVEEHVPAFTQLTQLFHNRKTAAAANFARRKCKHPQKKKPQRIFPGERFPKSGENDFVPSCGKAIEAGGEGFLFEDPNLVQDRRARSYTILLTSCRSVRIRKCRWDRRR